MKWSTSDCFFEYIRLEFLLSNCLGLSVSGLPYIRTVHFTVIFRLLGFDVSKLKFYHILLGHCKSSTNIAIGCVLCDHRMASRLP
jgi:hypothetical protein